MSFSSTTTTIEHNHPSGQYFISTDPSLISISSLNDAFSQEWMYWAQPLPEAEMRKMVEASLCFAVYKINSNSAQTPSSKPEPSGPQIGFARIITDYVTFAYLTDVYVLPEHQKAGLGGWLIRCVDEWIKSLPHLRRSMLVTSGDGGEAYYEKMMGMSRVGGKAVIMSWRGRGAVF